MPGPGVSTSNLIRLRSVLSPPAPINGITFKGKTELITFKDKTEPITFKTV